MRTPDITPTAILAALSTLEAAREARALKAALDLLPEDGQIDRVEKAANLLDALASVASAALDERCEAAAESGDFSEAARLSALRRSVDEYSSSVHEAHRVSYEFVCLSKNEEARAEVKDEDDLDEFTNCSF